MLSFWVCVFFFKCLIYVIITGMLKDHFLRSALIYLRSLISPIAVYCLNSFAFYKLFLVSSGSYWSRSARCEEICVFREFSTERYGPQTAMAALCHLTRDVYIGTIHP